MPWMRKWKPKNSVYSLAFFFAAVTGVRRNNKRGPNVPSSAESFGGASLRFCGFFFPILRSRVCVERMQKTSGDRGDFIDCAQERSFVRLRRFIKTADFSHELERSSSNLFGSDGRIEVEEGFDIPAHSVEPPGMTFPCDFQGCDFKDQNSQTANPLHFLMDKPPLHTGSAER